MTAARPDDGDAVIGTLETAGFPPGQARELAARIREEVKSWPSLSGEQREQLKVLLDVSGEVPGHAA